MVFFAKSKSNQTGECSEDPWHVYSNPLEPHLCPVLALGKYLLTHPDILKGNGLLFPGQHQYNRFLNIFNKVVKENKDDFARLGVREGDLGSHSCRKGAITLVSAGCTVSPPMAAICLRACWSMGPVKDCYIHYEKARDQFVGRSATGVSSLTKQFALSPVYWELSDEGESASVEVDRQINENLVSMDEVSGETFDMVRYLFASIVFHYKHLNENLHPTNGLRGSPLFIAASLPRLQQLVAVRYPWNATSCTPFFTGIPPPI